MRRREFLSALGAALAVPSHGFAQQSRAPRVGILLVGDREPFWRLFTEGLRDLGYVEERNIRFEYRSAQGRANTLPELAAELAKLDCDVIVASETPAVAAVKQATRDVPIVMAAAGDPVATGLIASLAQPGGNVTGLSAATAEIAGKSLELIREIVPATRRVGVIALADNPFTRPFFAQIDTDARTLGIVMEPIEVRGADDFDTVLARLAREKAAAVVFQPSLPLRPAAQTALKHRLPAVSVTRSFAEAGGLVSYAASLTERYRGAATYVDRILKGAKPAELPVGQPTKFELVINMKTDQALGLRVPQTLIARADEVID